MHEYDNVQFAVRLHQRTFPQALYSACRTGVLVLSCSLQNIFDDWNVQMLHASFKSVKSIHSLIDDVEEQIEAKYLLLF